MMMPLLRAMALSAVVLSLGAIPLPNAADASEQPMAVRGDEAPRLGNDTYALSHEGGTDTLQAEGGRLELAAIEILRHGNDLLLRWNHDRPADVALIRSWFIDAKYRVERLALPDGTVVPLEPLAARARQATSEDVIHFAPPRTGTEVAVPPAPRS